MIGRLRDRGAYVEKNHGSSLGQGRPDLTGSLYGWFVAIEAKERGRRPTTMQEFVLDSIRRSGGYAGVIDNREDFDAFMLSFPAVCRACLAPLTIRDDSVVCSKSPEETLLPLGMEGPAND